MENENKLVRVLTAIATEPWLLTPQMHQVITDIAAAHAFGGERAQAQHVKAAAMPERPRKREYTIVDQVAVIPLEGIVGRKFSDMLYSSGVTSVDILQRMIDTAAMDPDIKAILLTTDSPGGMVMGTPEAAEAVRKAREQKPVVAFADGLMCSAAYWIASGASDILATPSAEVGSIGCYMAILDKSRMAEMMGLRVEMFKSGKFKGMGAPGTSLNDEQRAMLQANVDRIANDFKSAVRAGRGAIADEIMQGQAFSVGAAKDAGLIDGIASLDEAMTAAIWLAENRNRERKDGKRQ